MSEFSEALFGALERVGINPVLVLGVTDEGVWKLAVHPEMRRHLADPEVREAAVPGARRRRQEVRDVPARRPGLSEPRRRGRGGGR